MKNVTVNTPDYETLMVVQAVRRLYRPKKMRFRMTHVVELNRRLVAGYLHFSDLPRVKELKCRVMDYNDKLLMYGIKDHQVDNTQYGRARALRKFVYRACFLCTFAIICLPA